MAVKENKYLYEEYDYIISVKNLHKYYYDTHILKGIDFWVKPGELIAIIGRSGCGKTTFLRCLNALEILDSGMIRIAGINLNRNSGKNNGRLAKKKRSSKKEDSRNVISSEEDELADEDFKIKLKTLRTRVGMLFQGFNLFPHLNVLQNVMLAPTVVKKESKEQATLRAVQLLEKVGLEDFAKAKPNELSGGQAQRVAIARALAMSPQVMLYDEPTSSLDPELVGEVTSVMKNLNKEGMTQVIVTHEMDFAKTAADKIVYMEDGQIVESAPPDVIFSNPRDERTRVFLKKYL